MAEHCVVPGCTRADVDHAGWCATHVEDGMNETEEAAFMVVVARIHEATRTRINALCRHEGYGCVITEAASAWARRDNWSSRAMALWLRTLANDIEAGR